MNIRALKLVMVNHEVELVTFIPDEMFTYYPF